MKRSSDIVQYIPGPFLNAYNKTVPETILHAREAMVLRDLRSILKNLGVWTADFPMYRVENGDAFLYFGSRGHNLIFRDIENAVDQIRRTKNYIPPQSGIDEVVSAAANGSVLRINVDELQLMKHHPRDEYGFFSVQDDIHLLDAQRQFVEIIYGVDQKPGKRVYVLTSDCVKKILEGKQEQAIARVPGLGKTVDGIRFCADGWGVGSSSNGLLGSYLFTRTKR